MADLEAEGKLIFYDRFELFQADLIYPNRISILHGQCKRLLQIPSRLHFTGLGSWPR